MIIAVEVKKNVWDFSCTNNHELYKALEISRNTLEVKFIDFSKFSFGASLPDIALVTKALSEKGIRFCYDPGKEAMAPLDIYTENSRTLPVVNSGYCSEGSLMAVKGG